MNNISIDNFKNKKEYINFINKNKGSGNLIIRAYAANEAIPISNVKIVVSLIIDDNNVIFYNGSTDSSGMIPKITLPAPIYNDDNLIEPLYTVYDISASYNGNIYTYKVNLYDDICVLQTINIVPDIMERKFYYYGD